MSEGRSKRLTAPPVAALVSALVLGGAGCQPLPVPRQYTGSLQPPPPLPPPNSTSAVQVPALEPTTVASDEREILPPLPEEKPVALAQPAPGGSATPLIDEALNRAQDLRELNRSSLEESDPEPTQPVPAPKETPAPDPSGPDTKIRLTAATASPAKEPAKPTAKEKATVIPEPVPEKPRTPAELWREGLERLRTLAREQAVKEDPSSPAWDLRSRWLECVQRQEEAGGSNAKPLWRAVLAALAASSGSPESEAQAHASKIHTAVLALEDQAPLEIVELRLCRKVNGFGNYEPLDPAACKAGQALIVYCEMSGLHYSAAGDHYQSRLSSQIELIPAQGGDPVWKQGLGAADDLCRRRRRDYYVNYRVVLPEHLPPGAFELRITQTDEIAGKVTRSSIPLAIRP